MNNDPQVHSNQTPLKAAIMSLATEDERLTLEPPLPKFFAPAPLEPLGIDQIKRSMRDRAEQIRRHAKGLPLTPSNQERLIRSELALKFGTELAAGRCRVHAYAPTGHNDDRVITAISWAEDGMSCRAFSNGWGIVNRAGKPAYPRLATLYVEWLNELPTRDDAAPTAASTQHEQLIGWCIARQWQALEAYRERQTPRPSQDTLLQEALVQLNQPGLRPGRYAEAHRIARATHVDLQTFFPPHGRPKGGKNNTTPSG